MRPDLLVLDRSQIRKGAVAEPNLFQTDFTASNINDIRSDFFFGTFSQDNGGCTIPLFLLPQPRAAHTIKLQPDLVVICQSQCGCNVDLTAYVTLTPAAALKKHRGNAKPYLRSINATRTARTAAPSLRIMFFLLFLHNRTKDTNQSLAKKG